MALNVIKAAAAKKFVTGEGLPCDEGCDMPDDITSLMEQSKTAKAIYDYVSKQTAKINLCFFKCKYQDSYGPVFIHGAVFDNALMTVWFNLEVSVYNSEATKKSELLVPPSLVFFHEFGHAKQYLENKAQFEQWEAEGFGGLGYNKKIEDDNLLRHEWPVCDEMSPPFPRRTNYPRWCGLSQEIDELKKKLG